MTDATSAYPLTFDVDYPDRQLNRLSTAFRILWVIPAGILLAVLEGGVLALPVGLMLVFRHKYPHWFFDWNLNYMQFSSRVAAYALLLTDEYPSSDEEQSVHLDMTEPDGGRAVSRWMPLVKWILAIPHYIVLVILSIGVLFAVFAAWLAILFTGRYPRGIFDFVVGVLRWGNRVVAYAFALVTDEYPPFRLGH